MCAVYGNMRKIHMLCFVTTVRVNLFLSLVVTCNRKIYIICVCIMKKTINIKVLYFFYTYVALSIARPCETLSTRP